MLFLYIYLYLFICTYFCVNYFKLQSSSPFNVYQVKRWQNKKTRQDKKKRSYAFLRHKNVHKRLLQLCLCFQTAAVTHTPLRQ